MLPINNYSEIVKIIQSARERAFYKVNEELIGMYLQIGKYVSEKSCDAAYGDAYVQGFADFFAREYPELKGFTRRGLYRMRQFYELYGKNEKILPPVRQFGDIKVSALLTQQTVDKINSFFF